MKPQPNTLLTTLAITLAIAASSLGARAEDTRPTVNPSGTWNVTYPPTSAAAAESTLVLKLEGDKLSGTITRLTGGKTERLAIEIGKVKGDQITFSVQHYARTYQGNVAQPPDKDQLVQRKFEGRMSGDGIKGKVAQTYQGNTHTRDWEAKRIKK